MTNAPRGLPSGCHAVHISLDGRLDPDLERRGAESIARMAGVHGCSRITLLSGTSVAAENCWYAGTRAKFEAEAAVRASGVPYTIFQATFFMETLPRFVRGRQASILGTQPQPWHWVAVDDFGRMLSRAYRTPPSVNKTLHVFGPAACTLPQALQIYCAMLRPGARIMAVPFWLADLLARIWRDQELKAVLPFFRYSEVVPEAGDPSEANALLGAPTTTLLQWCQQQAARQP